MAELAFENVSFTYPGASEPVIENMSFAIADGEAHALLGASGAGKTTLLSLMSGLLRPTAGRILKNGEDVTTQDGFARGVAQVFQFPVVYEGLSVGENMRVPMRSIGMPEQAQQERVAWLADELGLQAVLHRKPRALSLFQKQLLAVGKALARTDVSVVLLDEPLTAVEPHIKWRLRQTLRKAQADAGVTMVYVTHDQTEALTFADRVSLLTANGLEQTGTPRELYEAPVNEYVAHFVGSPGMNILPDEAANFARELAADRVGFRPEWAHIADQPAHVAARVTRLKPRGTRHGSEWGEIHLATDAGHKFVIDGNINLAVGSQVDVRLDRWVMFKDGAMVQPGDEVDPDGL